MRDSLASRLLRCAAAASLLLGLSACNLSCSGDAEKDNVVPANPPARPDRPAKTNAGESLRVLGHVPPFQLVDQAGAAFDSRQLRNRLWVVNFIFTRCTATCPRQTAQLQRLQEELKDDSHWDEMRLVSISVDPQHDTPEVLKDYAAKHAADTEHWKFLTGAREDLWNLSKQGFKLAVGENPPGEAQPLFHSPSFVLVDFYGRIRGMYDAETSEGLDELKRGIAAVLKERLPVPDDVLRPDWIEPRKQAQLEAAGGLGAFHDFQFTDRLEESGIRFRNKIVDDAGKTWKEAHYDHGNGIAIADVDGDGFSDIYFTTQAGGNELWRNRGDGTFENITQPAGVSLEDRISVTASFADTDNDGDADLFVTTVRHGNVLFENDGRGRFRDISQEAGLDYAGHSSAGVFFDYDRDGLLDLFLANVGRYTSDEVGTVTMEPVRGEDPGVKYQYYRALPDGFAGHLKPEERNERSILYRNAGGNRFVDVSAETKLLDESWSGDATPIDVNGDGWLDLYVLSMQGHDQYYENVEGREFVRKSGEVFPSTPWGSMGVKVHDYNGDGQLDLFITDMHSDMSESIGPEREKLKSNMRWPDSLVQIGRHAVKPDRTSIWGNAFFRRTESGAYEEVSDVIGAENYWPWGLSVGDLNADGYDDAFIGSSMNTPFRYGVNTLLLNDRGERFFDSEYILGVEPRRDGRTAIPWFELDASGRDKDHPLSQGRSGRYVVWSALGTKASVLFDIEGDGDLDIVTNEANDEPMVLVSDLAQKRGDSLRFLKLQLVGSKSNRDGLGSIVTVTAGSRADTKVYDGLSGYLSHSLYPLYFGLGEADTVDSIEVRWPSGRVQTIAGPLETNRLMEITEPAE